ncbi:universal stress protein [halophilic archaeon]|nr:universal stress protein [halophilic archaeon]
MSQEPHEFDSTVHFLHVADIGAEMSESGVDNNANELQESLTDMAEEALTGAESQAEEADVHYDRTILEGDPYEAIVKYSADSGADLVVMGASGQSGIKEHLLGSTTDHVSQPVDTSIQIVHRRINY